jgi:NAD-dependent deacetylase
MHSNLSSIVVLTGAGISAESGVRTFRGADGLWEGHRLEDVATPEAFQRNPEMVYRFYNERRQQLRSPSLTPNAAHRALAEFEHNFDGEFLLVTQNIDDLHDRAGSKNLIHLHGELLKARCVVTGELHPWLNDFNGQDPCPCCGETGNLRPHVVWFGEMPLEMERIYNALLHCDLFVSIGTSGLVYPAAGFGQNAASNGAHTVELNLEETERSPWFHETLQGPASELVPDFFSKLGA